MPESIKDRNRRREQQTLIMEQKSQVFIFFDTTAFFLTFFCFLQSETINFATIINLKTDTNLCGYCHPSQKTTNIMKKVILLAVAAVIYTASANAQTATPIGITIPDGYQATSFYISGNGEKAIAGFKKDESVKFLLYEKNGKTFSQGTAVHFLDELIAQKKNPTTPSLSHDGTRIYFSAKNENGDNDIFYSDKNNGQWDTPVNMGENINTAADEMYPSVSSDGLSIYFTRPKSDVKDSRCGVIYASQRAPYGEWSEATALVEPLNLGCETAPYISPDNKTLYMS